MSTITHIHDKGDGTPKFYIIDNNNEWKDEAYVRAMGLLDPAPAVVAPPPLPPLPVAPAMPTLPPMPTMPGMPMVGMAPTPGAPTVPPTLPGMPSLPIPDPFANQPMTMPGAPSMAMPGTTQAAAPSAGADWNVKDFSLKGMDDKSNRIIPESTEVEAEIISISKAVANTDARTPLVKIEFKTVFPEEYKGITILNNIAMTGPGKPGGVSPIVRFKSLARSADLLDASEEYSGDVTLQSFVGKVVGFEIKHGAWQNGDPRNEVRWSFFPAYRAPGLALTEAVNIPPTFTAPAPPVAPVEEVGPNEQGVTFHRINGVLVNYKFIQPGTTSPVYLWNTTLNNWVIQ